jgi:hypothetical protein
MSETILLQKNQRYESWEEREYEGTLYLLSPDKWRIAYSVRSKYVELTWNRSVGGIGAHQWESTLDYVQRRLRGQAEKKDVRNLAAVLNYLSAQYGRR